MSRAMDRDTGKAITGAEEIRQSVRTILGTIPGERVMRAEYGSELYDLTDIPLNGSGRARVTQATAGALTQWEPRLRITRVVFSGLDATGQIVQEIHGTVTATREEIKVRP